MHILAISSVVSAVASIASAVFTDRFLMDRIPVIGSFAGFELSYNSGIAFGIQLPPIVQEVLIGIALVLVAIIAVRHIQKAVSCPSERRTGRAGQLSAVSFGLILGGGIANVIDRIPDGLVTDFIQMGTFPTFNIADSCITVGAALLLWESWRHR